MEDLLKSEGRDLGSRLLAGHVRVVSVQARAGLMFVAITLLAGANSVGIRFSNRELAPLWGAGVRVSLAAALLVLVMAVFRLALPRGRALSGAVLYGLLTGTSWALAYYGLVQIHAGFGQVIIALAPLATLLLAVVQRQERFRLGAFFGSLLALIGVGIMSRGLRLESVPWVSLLALVGSAICLAEATVLVRVFPPVHPVTMNAVGMMVGAPLLLGGAVLADERLVLPHHAVTWIWLGYLVVIGSVVVLVLNVILLRYWSASRAAYVFALIPVVTVVLSAWLDNEPIGVDLVFGGVLVLGGAYVGALRPYARIAQPPGEAKVAS